MRDKICRMLIGESGFEFEHLDVLPADLQELINSDKSYGMMKPKNGKEITWSIGNEDTEISIHEMKKVVEDVVFSYQLEFNIKFKYTDDYKNADVKISFGDEGKDVNLTSNTIAYMGYPFPNSEFYGILVINRKFTFTHDGKPRTGEEMIAMGIQVQFKNGTYGTLYLVKIIRHEFGHGVLGLPHDPLAGNTMAYREDLMVDYWSERDLQRGYAKFGKRTMIQRLRDRLREWFKIGGRR